MATPTITELHETWSRRDYATSRVGRFAVDRLADGMPVTPGALAAATGLSIPEVTALIEGARQMGIEVEDGAVVGGALTLRPTRHRFRVRGHDLYAWCGFDALFLPIMLGERVEVASTCPVSGAEIRLTVEADGTVSAATPPGAVVAIAGEEVTSCCSVSGPTSAICTQMPFFASREAGERWQADHPGVAIVDLDDTRSVARAYVRPEVRLEGSFLTLPGRRLWVEQAGDGPAVVLVHAGLADRRMWDDQVAALSDRYRVVRYDHPGYGRSDPATEPYSYVEELDAVLDHAGVDRAAAVGCSMGGRVAVDYALARPDRVTALVPVAAGVSGYVGDSTPCWADLEAAIDGDDGERIAAAATRMWAPLRTDPDVDARIHQLIADNVAGIATMGTMWLDQPPAWGRLADIRTPTLVVVGDRDQPEFVRIAEQLAKEVDGAHLEVLPDVDHNVPVRAGRAFTALLARFLDRLPL